MDNSQALETAPDCAYCGKELELTCSYDSFYDDMIISGRLYCPDCWELDVWAEPPLTGADLERWEQAMAENQRRSDAYGAASEGEPPAPVLNPREF